jgi:hypothetical protein
MTAIAMLAAVLAAAPVQDSPLVRASKSAKLGNQLPVGPAAPEIAATRWWNSPPLDLKSMRGSVVLVDF